MLVVKHVDYRISNSDELKGLLRHLEETTARVPGVILKDILFPRDKNEFVLALDCVSEERYLEWRGICPPPADAKDWYEVLLNRDEYLARQV